jgi:hypothetical protein
MSILGKVFSAEAIPWFTGSSAAFQCRQQSDIKVRAQKVGPGAGSLPTPDQSAHLVGNAHLLL